jgi:cytochrome b561
VNNATREHWDPLLRNLHWFMAVLLIAQWVGGKVGQAMDASPTKIDVMLTHKSTGIVILLLALLRLGWRLHRGVPASAPGLGRWQRLAARAGHGLLYALMIALPVSGWLYNSAKGRALELYWTVPLPAIAPRNEALEQWAEETHEVLATAFAVVFVAHVLAALWHHWVRRDDTLRRMAWPRGRA